MAANTGLFLFSIMIILFQTISSQSISPAPSGPTNITQILEKAGQFTTFIKLLKSTQAADRINSQLNTTSNNQGLTVFVPTDNAFSSLKSGTLNTISSQDQLQLVQFHILPSLYTMSQFQTVSNPLHTQAGSSDDYPLNVTTSGNQVNVTTGVVDTTVSNTIYSDSNLAVYQVDRVLLPMALFGASAPTAAPADAPAPTKAEKNVRDSDAPSGAGSDTSADASGAVSGQSVKGGVVAFVAAVLVVVVTVSCL